VFPLVPHPGFGGVGFARAPHPRLLRGGFLAIRAAPIYFIGDISAEHYIPSMPGCPTPALGLVEKGRSAKST